MSLNEKFVFIGDSITFGYGVPKNQGWVSKLSTTLKSEVINKGVNGDTTPSMLNRFYEDVITHNPKYIFIMGGTNDLLSGRSIDSILSNITEMINEGIEANSTIYIGIPPYIIKEMANKLFIPSPFYSYCENSLPILRTELINLCKKRAIKYFDFYNLTLDNLDKNIYIDGIHLNFLGNTFLLNEAIKVLSI
ncbi:GDSL-type esterase/lipase family protein [Clostridium paraputrificum]|uniref:GDSL-type esterase/lipase family protein n=1 Tax=Clostridium paraputrificum TaxID=29363 RepID=UPI003D325FD1